MKEKHQWKAWEIPIAILWLIGLFTLFHGIGYSKHSDTLDFKGGYFVIGILIVAPIYLYIRSTIESEKGFPLENFHKDIVVQDIKRHKIFKNIDLSHAVIESYVFGVGKNQNDYANIFYNKNDIEFVKTKITIQNYDKSLPILTAFTNIDKITLNEIFQKHSTTKVYFDKYIPNNYYIDLEFLIDLGIMETAQTI
ncbi:hypothetical protein [Chryseobacterium polytrichastri]|uniref:Uncharacterized protein n=1 Tax=Chryseobacterium polytrichastri TaxID=1302687 RepID=A0A1M7F8S8_9FLAO|nr:hypothetical protein [Chryseobacterium polytrichastri]SHM00482.1 hypothetical protein SAMN05444267_103110 [Chryseobacterium polytrichastri]